MTEFSKVETEKLLLVHHNFDYLHDAIHRISEMPNEANITKAIKWANELQINIEDLNAMIIEEGDVDDENT